MSEISWRRPVFNASPFDGFPFHCKFQSATRHPRFLTVSLTMRASRVTLLVAVSALALALMLLPCEAKKGKIKRSKQNREKLTSREEEFRTAPPVEARKRAEEAISLATETEPVTAQTNHTHSDGEINPDVDARENVKSQASSPHALLSNHGQVETSLRHFHQSVAVSASRADSGIVAEFGRAAIPRRP